MCERPANIALGARPAGIERNRPVNGKWRPLHQHHLSLRPDPRPGFSTGRSPIIGQRHHRSGRRAHGPARCRPPSVSAAIRARSTTATCEHCTWLYAPPSHHARRRAGLYEVRQWIVRACGLPARRPRTVWPPFYRSPSHSTLTITNRTVPLASGAPILLVMESQIARRVRLPKVPGRSQAVKGE
jgi:hypothetical protein